MLYLDLINLSIVLSYMEIFPPLNNNVAENLHFTLFSV